MKDLIEALTILLKYQKENTYAPTHCEHDVLTVVDIDCDAVTADDEERLDKLGFHRGEHEGCYDSFRFGSA